MEVSPYVYFQWNETVLYIQAVYSVQNVRIDIPSSVVNSTHLTVMFFSDGKFSYRIYNDLQNPRNIFDHIYTSRTIPVPYEKNFF